MNAIDFIKFKQFGRLDMAHADNPLDVASIEIRSDISDRNGEVFLVGYKKASNTSEPEIKLSLDELLAQICNNGEAVTVETVVSQDVDEAFVNIDNLGNNKFKVTVGIPRGKNGMSMKVNGYSTLYYMSDTPEIPEDPSVWTKYENIDYELARGKYVLSRTEIDTTDGDIVMYGCNYVGSDSSAAFSDGTMQSINVIGQYSDLSGYSYENSWTSSQGEVHDKPTSESAASTYPYWRFEWTLANDFHEVIYLSVPTTLGNISVTVEYGVSSSSSVAPSSWSSTAPTSVAQGNWIWTKLTCNGVVSYSKSYVAEDGNDGAAALRGTGWHVTNLGTFASQKSERWVSEFNEENTISGDMLLHSGTGNIFVCTGFLDDGKALWDFTGNIRGPQGNQGAKGDEGDTGQDGQDGADGAYVTSVTRDPDHDVGDNKAYKMTFSNSSEFGFSVPTVKGDTGDDGNDGQDGQNGQDGFSPTVNVTSITGGYQVTITDVNGPHIFNVTNGIDGQDGQQGIQGIQGPIGTQGIQGIPGDPGTDGKDGTAFVDETLNLSGIQWGSQIGSGNSAYYRYAVNTASNLGHWNEFLGDTSNKKIDFLYGGEPSNIALMMRMGVWFGIDGSYNAYVYCLEPLSNQVTLTIRYYTNLPE